MVAKIFIVFFIAALISEISNSHPGRKNRIIFRKRGSLAYAKDADFNGQELNWYWASSFEDCHSRCEWYGDSCTHFIYSRFKGKCFLKTGLAFTFTAHPRYDQTLEAAIRCDVVRTEECRNIIQQNQWIPKFFVGPPAKFLHSTGCYFNEDTTIASFYNATQEQCTGECRRNPSCTHYNFYFGYCDMFQGKVEYEDVQKCEAPHCHCGIDCHADTNTRLCHSSGEYEYHVIQQPMKAPISYQDYVDANQPPVKAIEFHPLSHGTGTK